MNKLKLLLLSLVGITALISTTHALEIVASSKTYKVLSSINWYHIRKWGNSPYFSYSCLTSDYDTSISSTYGIQLDASLCDDGDTSFLSHASYSTFPTFGSLGSRNYSSRTYYWNKTTKKIYKIARLDKEWGGSQYLRLNMNEGSVYKIQSKRGSNLYITAFFYWPWLLFTTKKNDQVKVATYVSNAYVLDGFAIFADSVKLLLVDTYKNKVYDYWPIRQSVDSKLDNTTLFNKIYNLSPDKIYDIQRWVWTNKFRYTPNTESLNFDLHNEQPATEETHTTIQQDLKDSLTWLNEYSHLWLGTTPEELGITNGQPNTPHQGNNSGNNFNQSYEQSLAEYNQCVQKYKQIKAMTAHSDGCFWSNLDDSERQTYWYNVIDGNDWQYNTRDKIRYWRCRQFAEYKNQTQKFLKSERDPFWQEWKKDYLWLEAKDVDIPALCGQKPRPEYNWEKASVWSSSWFNQFRDALSSVWNSRNDQISVGSGQYLKKNDVDRFIGTYIMYETACRDRTYLPTPLDGYVQWAITAWFGGDNNLNVCAYSVKLLDRIEKEYWSLKFPNDYVDAVKREIRSKIWTWINLNIFNDSWGIDKQKLKEIALQSPWNPFVDPSDEGVGKILSFLKNGYDKGYSKAFELLWYKNCGIGLGSEKWDYIIYVILFFIFFKLFRWRK